MLYQESRIDEKQAGEWVKSMSNWEINCVTSISYMA